MWLNNGEKNTAIMGLFIPSNEVADKSEIANPKRRRLTKEHNETSPSLIKTAGRRLGRNRMEGFD